MCLATYYCPGSVSHWYCALPCVCVCVFILDFFSFVCYYAGDGKELCYILRSLLCVCRPHIPLYCAGGQKMSRACSLCPIGISMISSRKKKKRKRNKAIYNIHINIKIMTDIKPIYIYIYKHLIVLCILVCWRGNI